MSHWHINPCVAESKTRLKELGHDTTRPTINTTIFLDVTTNNEHINRKHHILTPIDTTLPRGKREILTCQQRKMEFDLASKRLQREQQQRSKPSSKLPRSMMMMNGTPQQLKEQQLHQKQLRQQQEEKRQKERQQKLFETHLFQTYRQKYDAQLHLQSLVSPSTTSTTTTTTTLPVVVSPSQPPPLQQHLQLIPVSIHGIGDKIALPPSLLERLLQQPQRPAAAPWTFRLGIRNPTSFTSRMSPELQSHLQEHFRHDDDDDDDDLPDEMDDDEDDVTSPNNRPSKKQFLNDMSHYMKELQQYQYLSYTHGTVIEFTQEEGYIGIPKAVAAALLTSSTTSPVETTRTVDPATAVAQPAQDETMDHAFDDDDEGEKTPGHVAYNAFDIPAAPIEIVLLQLPKGTGMTLRPMTKSFDQLQQDQIKFALEQSIQRTRATITRYDTLTTWYRGKEYQFLVTKLVSSTPTNCYNAISCINTDMEIDFEPMPTDDTEAPIATDIPTSTTSTGRRLTDEPRTTTTPVPHQDDTRNTMAHNINEVPPEPPADETNRIITIQFRFPNQRPSQQRRFDITTTTIRDLFTFVQLSRVQLVRRYPRRIFTPQDDHLTLEQAGFQSGNELLIVEEQ